MARRAKKKRGPKPKFLDIRCPNSQCKHFDKKGLGNVVSNGTYRPNPKHRQSISK